eukprot:EG_transcript_34056
MNEKTNKVYWPSGLPGELGETSNRKLEKPIAERKQRTERKGGRGIGALIGGAVGGEWILGILSFYCILGEEHPTGRARRPDRLQGGGRRNALRRGVCGGTAHGVPATPGTAPGPSGVDDRRPGGGWSRPIDGSAA